MTAPAGWRSRIVGHGAAAPGQLLANPRNWRSHGTAQRDALAGVLDQVGWVQDVIVNRTTGHVVDGHLRVSLAISRGEASIPVVYVELNEAEEGLVLASIDPLSAMAGQNTEALLALLAEITIDSAALAEALRLAAGGAKEGLRPPDALPPEPAQVYVEPAQVWRLGGHRLMCGDATDPADVTRLLDGAKPLLTVTDPPYGVEYDPTWRAGARRKGKVANDDRADWSAEWALTPSDVLYAWHGGLHAAVVAQSVVAAGFAVRAQIIWAKPARRR